MGKFAPDVTLDQMLDFIAGCTALVVCVNEPADFAAVRAGTNDLAEAVLAGGDFTKANGDTSGRKVTVAAKNGMSIGENGDAQHIALVTASELRYVTTCTLQTLTSGGTVNSPAFDIEIADPA